MPVSSSPALAATAEQVRELRAVARSGSRSHREVVAARGLLMAIGGQSTRGIAGELSVSQARVRRWRSRFLQDGVAGVGRVAPGRGRKRTVSAELAAQVVRITATEEPPDGGTHWSTRLLAKRLSCSRETVRRVWRAFDLKPWRTETFKVSNDPRFEEKLVDVVGLYLNPPERAAVFCFDEKTQVQALDRTQPSLPMKRGRRQTMTHDYKRNGTTDLFAALNLKTGQVITDYRDSHTASDVLAFFKQIDKQVPRDLDIHVVLDNLSAHKADEVTRWLQKPRQKRWHLHFTPTSASWLNLVERWFRELTQRCLKRGSFVSIAHLIYVLSVWIAHWNENPAPYQWTATADDILTKVNHARQALDLAEN
jgi:transposase